MDSVVRLLIDHLNAPERAGAIVRQTRSSEGAQIIARYCKSVGDFRGAIEFPAPRQVPRRVLQARGGQRRDEAVRAGAPRRARGVDRRQDPAALHERGRCGRGRRCRRPRRGPGAVCGRAAASSPPSLLVPVPPSPRPHSSPPRSARASRSTTEGKANFAEAGQFYAEARDFHRALKLFLQCGEAAIDRRHRRRGQGQAGLGHARAHRLPHGRDGCARARINGGAS